MVKYGTAIAFLLSTTTVHSFHNIQSHIISNVRENGPFKKDINKLHLRVASPSSNPEFSNNNMDTLGEALNTVTVAARDTIAEVVSDEPDVDEVEIAEKKRLVGERVKTFRVTLPLSSSALKEDKTGVLSIGLTLCQISKGRVIESDVLDLDTLKLQRSNPLEESTQLQKMDEALLARRVDGEFQGLVVSSVVEGSSAWVAGVKAGDILRTTSATLGSKLWPKSTFEGVRSVITSRKATAGSIEMEFERPCEEALDNKFELTLSRPIGLELKETEDGYVEVTGFTQNVPTLVQYAVKVGDRVLAVDSSLGGKLWPVSTVEGVISAVTSRLPGQQITFRFERPAANMDETTTIEPTRISQPELAVTATTTPTVDQKELLKRCRDIIKRYTVDEQANDQFVNKYAVPGLVADKVVDALASAGAQVDRITLSMIMSAYLSCRQPEKAIRVFEATVGLNAYGSVTDSTSVIKGENGLEIIPNTDALDVFTVSALLKAHAMKGDLDSVRRVLTAVEGREGTNFGGAETALWPGTGKDGTLRPDARCYNIVMSAAVDSKSEDGVALALQIFDGLIEPNRNSKVDKIQNNPAERNLVSYNIIINALANMERYEDAIDLFYSMLKAGVKPDKFTYTSLVKAVVATGDVEELMYDMREQGVTPDVVTFNTVVKLLCEQRRLVTAKKVINLMEGSGVAPDSMTYGLLMKGLLDAGNPSAALTLFETACADRRTVALTENVYLYTTAITASAAMGDHERALELLSRMTNAGVKPTLKTMTALLGACLASGKADVAVDVYKRIPSPDGYAMTQGIRALCENGNIEEALKQVVEDDKSLLSGKQLMLSYKSMIQSALNRRDYALARQLLTSLMKNGNIPSKAIYEAIFASLKIFPKSRRGLNTVESPVEMSTDSFLFLLFLLDSISRRNLPCEGPLYSAILSYGLRLGGLPKKIASFLISAKSTGEVDSEKNRIIADVETKATSIVSSWEELYLNYDDLKSLITDPAVLPGVTVRVASRDVVKVLKAEQGLSYRRARPRRATV